MDAAKHAVKDAVAWLEESWILSRIRVLEVMISQRYFPSEILPTKLTGSISKVNMVNCSSMAF